MPDEVDPGLETSLRSFLNEIKAQPLPRPLADFEPAGVRPRRKALNLFAGATGVAVIAAGVAVFAVELNGHHGAGSPIPGGLSAATPTPEATPPILPSDAANAPAPHSVVLIPKTYGSGAETLPTVTLGPNEGIGIEYGCSSTPSEPLNTIWLSGHGLPEFLGLHFQFWLHQFSTTKRCSGTLLTGGGQGGPLTVRFNAHPSVRWVILVYEYPSRAVVVPKPPASAPSFPGPTPPFLGGPAPAGATVLIPPTYGTGPMTLPSFTATPNENVSVELGCLSTSPSVTTVTVKEYDPAFAGDTVVGQCYYGDAGGSGGGGSNGFTGTVTMKVQAAPTEKWVILVYEGGNQP